MSEAINMLAEVLDDLDELYFSATPEIAKKITLIEKKLKKVSDTICKEEADAETRGIDGQEEGLDNDEEGWEYEGPENDCD
jgi:hypothetical protein